MSLASDSDQLGLQISLEALGPVLTADPARLVAAIRTVRAVPVASVHRDRSGPDASRDGKGPALGRGEDAARQPVRAVVADADRMVVVILGRPRLRRADNLL